MTSETSSEQSIRFKTRAHLGVQAWDEDGLHFKQPVIEADLFGGVIPHGAHHHHVTVPRV